MRPLGNVSVEQFDKVIAILEKIPKMTEFTIILNKEQFMDLGGTEEEWDEAQFIDDGE